MTECRRVGPAARICPNCRSMLSIQSMQRTRVKICGVGHVEDALAAARAGADAVGLVFHPDSRRSVQPQRAMEILAALPPFVSPVGLFVDLPVSAIWDAVRSLNLRHVQLHGHESAEQVAELRGLTVLKAIRVDPATFGPEIEQWRRDIQRLKLTHLQGFVLETAGTVGGSGVANDWELVALHRKRGDFVGLPPIIAAGGLTPDTVADVVRAVHPWAVDVSTGVESSPGRKSPEKIEAFIRAAQVS
jgi:phosphoribosylanthranilate isomerase